MAQNEFQVRVEAATELSLFRQFPTAERERLFAGARRVEAPAGATLFLGASPQPGLVVEGVVKVFLMSARIACSSKTSVLTCAGLGLRE